MSHVFPRHTRYLPPTVADGKGCYLYDTRGRAYLDGSGGAAVSCLGHGHADVIEAVRAQLDRIAFAHTGFFTSEPAERLADLLVKHAPGDLDRVYFVSGGSEAIEAAIKLARQYFVEIGETGRTRIVARNQSYHGNTLGALAAGGNRLRKAPFNPLMIETGHVSACFAYRGMRAGESEQEYGNRVAGELERYLLEVGPESVMAFIAEPVVGATLGAVPAVSGYFRAVREICDRHGVLLILDEVMCGMGRTGTLFACEQEDVIPDIITIAKGLGGGYQPIGAMMCSGKIHDAIAGGSGFFQHGHTYLGHPVACAAGLAVTTVLTEKGLVGRCRSQGVRLAQALGERFSEHPHVGDIRGRGLFRGLEFVRDRETGEPFDPELRVFDRLKQAAFESGLICYPMGGTVDGRRGDHVLIAPPFIIEDSQIDELVEKLAHAVDLAVGG